MGGTGRPGVGGDGSGQTMVGGADGPEGARWVEQACTLASLPLRGCSLLPSPLDSSCRGWTTTCLDRSGGPDQGGRPGSGRHLLLHQKQAVHVTNVGAPRVGLERGGAPGPVQSSTRTRSTSVLNSRCPSRGSGDWRFTPSILLAGCLGGCCRLGVWFIPGFPAGLRLGSCCSFLRFLGLSHRLFGL